ncbi:ImuA family protein [Pedobacter sp. AW1-32]|uniref:ImuA family protein n=1 Tax=Pedobacter sp. AW1-32 TaxID=3383026 RepID=UPI003FEF6585
MEKGVKKDVIFELKAQILALQGYKNTSATMQAPKGLDVFAAAFPNRVFPLNGIHEFISYSSEETASTTGFISGILSELMQSGSPSIWICTNRSLFPPALKRFSVPPESVIFIEAKNEKEILWVTEEALKCEGLAAVITELPELSFAASRRLQLVIEQSKVTAFFVRENPKHLNSTTCLARWQIKPLPSQLLGGMPGVGNPHWQAELIKVRNGKGGIFELTWSASGFTSTAIKNQKILRLKRLQAG